MYKIGLSTTGSKETKELFESYKSAGVTYAEISSSKDETDKMDFAQIKKWADESGIEIWSLHLPFYPFKELDISNKELAKSTVEYLSAMIKRASDAGIKRFIIHASGEPIDEADRKERMECAKNSLFTLAELASSLGGTIFVEDLPRTCLGRCASDIKELLSAHSSLRACFDTNHLLNEDNIEFIKEIGSKIGTLHVSDYDFVNERHWMCGEGKNDWQGILRELKNVGYDGPWMYEIDPGCPKTILRDRNITPTDLVKNANEVFENKEFTVFSKPKPNLGYWD